MKIQGSFYSKIGLNYVLITGSLYLIIDNTIEVHNLQVFPMVTKTFSPGTYQEVQLNPTIKFETAKTDQIID